MIRIAIVVFIGIASVICGCQKKTPVAIPSFYFWKNNAYSLSEAERKLLDTFHIKKLYVKYFEVARDSLWGNAPVAKTNLRINEWYGVNAEIIPVIFIKNEVMLRSGKQELDSLAQNITFLTRKFTNEKMNAVYKEIQIDCDWTEKSKENYFYFLQQFKKTSGKIVSVTLRLYPYKYSEKMGVPPVDKATLMCYNLVNALQNESKNSIIDINELQKYLDKERRYPLHLDIVLPAYSWMLLYQNDKFRGIISRENEALMNTLSETKPLWYSVTKDTVVDDFYIRTGDKIKYETVSPEVLYKACDIINRNVALDDSVTISVFHLDEQKISTYSYEVFDSLHTFFSR
ncbi:MAG: hypothetical protein QM802_14175 [Agriterribacter sp.]